MKIDRFNFTKTTYYKWIDGKLYRNSRAGLIKENMKCTRNVGKYKIYVESIDAVIPYSDYTIVNTETGNIFTASIEHYHTGALKLIVDDLRSRR